MCQLTKNKPKTQVPMQPNPVSAEIWKSVTMDFITDLSKSRNSDLMFVIVDHFSKAIILTPCQKTITAKQTSQLYLDHVWQRTELPQQVILNQGPQFASKVMQEM